MGDAGVKVDAGLPEIEGYCGGIAAGDGISNIGGAFTPTTSASQANTWGGITGRRAVLRIAASQSNGIYSASPTVQPPTVKLSPAIYLGRPA